MMNIISQSCVVPALLAIMAAPALAQAPLGTPAQAVAEARSRLVCGTGTVVDATYVPGGLLRATCRAQARSTAQNNRLPAELQGTTLSTGALVTGGALLAIVVVATGGGSSDSSTTTTTSSGYISEE